MIHRHDDELMPCSGAERPDERVKVTTMIPLALPAPEASAPPALYTIEDPVEYPIGEPVRRFRRRQDGGIFEATSTFPIREGFELVHEDDPALRVRVTQEELDAGFDEGRPRPVRITQLPPCPASTTSDGQEAWVKAMRAALRADPDVLLVG